MLTEPEFLYLQVLATYLELVLFRKGLLTFLGKTFNVDSFHFHQAVCHDTELTSKLTSDHQVMHLWACRGYISQTMHTGEEFNSKATFSL